MKRKRLFDEDSFSKFLKGNYSKLNGNWRDSDGIWGLCCTSVGYANQPKNRKLLNTRWHNNFAGIRSQLMSEKSEDKKVPESSSLYDSTATSTRSSEIEKMMVPSFVMLQCSNCSVFFIFTSVIYDQCPLIDYLCSHCSLSSSEFQKRTKPLNIKVNSADDNFGSPLRSKKKVSDHGYCEESKKDSMINIDNFVNEVTVETSTSPSKRNYSIVPNKSDSGVNKFYTNEHIIYISDTDKSKKAISEIPARISKSGQVERDQEESSSRYQFILSYSHWLQINQCKGKKFKLMCGKIFTQYFSQFELGCSLSYRYCHIDRNNSWGKGSKYIKVVGVCKQDYCSKYIFTIDAPPKSDENIVVNISQIGSIYHDNLNNVIKPENSIISVEEPHKFVTSNQYGDAVINVQAGSPVIPVQYNSNYYAAESQIEDQCGEKSNYNESNSSTDDDDDDEGSLSRENEHTDIPDFDYSSHNQFTLDYKDWEKIMPSFDEQKLKRGWEKIFAEYFHQFELGCILEFAYCRLRKPFSMDNSVYLSTYAKCRYPNCSTFLFKITHKPIKGEIVIVDVYQQGCVSHKTDESTNDYNSPEKKVTLIPSEEEVYYTVDRDTDNQKNPLALDVSQIITVETSNTETIPGGNLTRYKYGIDNIKCELASSGSDSDDDAFNLENQILPYELNSEGKVLESVIHKFEINYEDWQKMKPLNHCKTLQPGWTDIFFQYFANLNLGCILAFSYCYANKRNIHKKGTNYLRIKSICKYTGCCKYYFNMKKEPKPGKNGKVKAIQVGTISHREGEVRARFIRGKCREELAKQLQNTSAFDFYNRNRSRLAESGYESTRKKSLHVLRNIKIEKKKEPLPSPSNELEANSNFDNFVSKIDEGCIRLI